MSTYIIGDVQGSFAELQALLNIINYDVRYDRLAFVGDLVNRGPDSLNTLRFIKSLKDSIVVLGNHDLHLLALASGEVGHNGQHTLSAVLNAPDKNELITWLRHQSLFYCDFDLNFVLVHAGLPPQWTVMQALDYAAEIEIQLRGDQYAFFLKSMYGEHPEEWSANLQGEARWRYIINAFTRLRFCSREGKLDLKNKTNYSKDPQLAPWFNWYRQPETVYFGHWAALDGYSAIPRCIALDTGCAWGGGLTAFRLEDRRRFYMPAIHPPYSE